MITILFRTVLIYVLLILAVRLMGKRQIGELEISDLVTTFLISEIASLPITDNSIPLSHAVIPIIALVFFEVASSVLIVYFPRLKKILTARPATLVYDGKIRRRAMRQARISTDELISELRQKGVTDVSEVLYAILEQNGKISIISKAPYRTPTAQQLGRTAKENGIYHIIIDQGVWNTHSLQELGLRKADVEHRLRARSLESNDIFLMMINDAGDFKIMRREDVV